MGVLRFYAPLKIFFTFTVENDRKNAAGLNIRFIFRSQRQHEVSLNS